MSADVAITDFPHETRHPYDARELEAIRQQERYKWFAERLTSRVDGYTVEQLLDKLGSDPVWPGQWEKAIVMLALKGSPEAAEALASIDTSETSDSFKSLYEYCLTRAVEAARSAA